MAGYQRSDGPTDWMDDGDTLLPRLRKGLKPFGERYELVELLGTGGMGTVWKAQDNTLHRYFALKFVANTVRQDPEALLDLERETRRCLDLVHPNIVRVFDVVSSETTAAIKMEYVEGGDLSKRKANSPLGCLNVSEVGPLLVEISEAIHYAHTQWGVVHRDIKPKNILVTTDGHAKVTDFGISQSITESMTRVTGRTSGAGAWPYMSPQQMDGDSATVSDDVYSVGATVYELLTGRPPFTGGDIPHQIRNKTPESMTTRRATLFAQRRIGESGSLEMEGIPEKWEEVIRACLSKYPEDRPTTVVELVDRLGLLTPTGSSFPNRPVEAPITVSYTKSSSNAPSSTEISQPPTKANKPASKTPLVFSLAALILISCGGGFAFLRTLQKQPPPEYGEPTSPKANEGQIPSSQSEPDPPALRTQETERSAPESKSSEPLPSSVIFDAPTHLAETAQEPETPPILSSPSPTSTLPPSTATPPPPVPDTLAAQPAIPSASSNALPSQTSEFATEPVVATQPDTETAPQPTIKPSALQPSDQAVPDVRLSTTRETPQAPKTKNPSTTTKRPKNPVQNSPTTDVREKPSAKRPTPSPKTANPRPDAGPQRESPPRPFESGGYKGKQMPPLFPAKQD